MDTSSLSSPPRAPGRTAHRLAWLDNLRIALTVLVVLHHAAQPYGPADWWYVQGQPRTGALATLSAVDGTFFMSLFFFASAVFVPGSYDRRGAWPFVKGRLIRLGIPVVAGALTIVPGLLYAYYVHYRGYPPISFPRYFTDVYLGLGDKPADWTGPSWPDLQFAHLWFIQNLLAYSVLYVACRQAGRLLRRRNGARIRRVRPAPGHRALLWLTVGIAAATFLVRLRYPLDKWVPFLDFLQIEPARLPQYAAFFTLGILAHRHDWLQRFDARTGWTWLSGGLAGVALLFAIGADADCFGSGGFNGPAALWAAYDSALCVSLCVGLLTLFREAVTRTSRLSTELAADSYGVYIVHLPLVVIAQYYLADRGLSAVGAWAVVSVLVVPAAFLLAAGLRRLLGFRRVL
ncbi:MULTISPECIES: acyltransferase family protein [Streptomyces]|uniref:Acyltransferase n=1 Tax=Streptomyces spinosisporus TaxID=2927582 RepID=A0ABS9XES6_9ACTN|nr:MULTISPECIES: acyltransferase [Streptomyces]MCI3240609.1 acyltransferase [Streptomyces spinosisporus]WUB37232.1 acyltransferase [Streptomyces sp. NBC_00588]